MPEHVASLIIGLAFAMGSMLLISIFNDRYTKREKYTSDLLLKRAKKE